MPKRNRPISAVTILSMLAGSGCSLVIILIIIVLILIAMLMAVIVTTILLVWIGGVGIVVTTVEYQHPLQSITQGVLRFIIITASALMMLPIILMLSTMG